MSYDERAREMGKYLRCDYCKAKNTARVRDRGLADLSFSRNMVRLVSSTMVRKSPRKPVAVQLLWQDVGG